LENEKVADNQIDTADLLKIDCKDASPPTAANTAASAVSIQVKATSIPFKTPLLVTFMAKPESVTDKLVAGWKPDSKKNQAINDGSVGILNGDDMKLHPSNGLQVMVGQLKFKGSTGEEREYTWSGTSETGPVFKQVSMAVIAQAWTRLTYSVSSKLSQT
jgi:hypothetical protein